MPGPITGFLDGFQTQLTVTALSSDTVLFFPTAGMVPGLQYHIRLDDSNPPTTFEYAVVQFRDTSSVNVVGGGAGRGIGGTAPLTHNQGPNSGYVTGILLAESLVPTFARLDTENLMAFASASGISGQFFNPYGLPGAVVPSRYVGATVGGAPSSGTFTTGDFVLDTVNGVIWICTNSGSPGNWQNVLDGTNTGLSGAVSSLTRWIGATGSGAPTSGTWKQGDVITDRTGKLWICIQGGTPGTWVTQGSVGYAQTIADQGSIVGAVDLTNTSVPYTFAAGRRYKLTGYCAFQSTVSNDYVNLVIWDGTTTFASVFWDLGVGSDQVQGTAMAIVVPGASTRTLRLNASRAVGTGTLTLKATPTNSAFLLIEDIGT